MKTRLRPPELDDLLRPRLIAEKVSEREWLPF
ncbi:hypothetical protein C357_03435 [Citreicella sp. 357]|nr:hypothetical protein C357_03435 [Citreicella sp. 357]